MLIRTSATRLSGSCSGDVVHHRGMCGYSARQAGMILELLRSGRIIGPDFPDASGRHERGGENGRRGAGRRPVASPRLSVTYLFAFTPSWRVLLVIIYPPGG